MMKAKILRKSRPNHVADRLCPKCKKTIFNDDWPMHTKALLLYSNNCYNCGQELDWEEPITIGGDE